MNFDDFFKTATNNFEPYPYQRRFATGEALPALLSVPTGVGKTATAVLGWLWRRRFADADVRALTPRRLVFCLPMRTLVEQTRDACQAWIDRLCKAKQLEQGQVGVHVLMGGADASHWDEHPERDAILIGTQDMLLSRALNRGYGMSRYQWPMHFGLLNNDCLWVVDETQLMGSGLLTTAQLEGFGHIWRRAKACQFLWMSATIDDGFLNTFDRNRCELTVASPTVLKNDDLQEPRLQKRLNAEKRVEVVKNRPSARQVLGGHVDGRMTLLILNTVPSARSMHAELRMQISKEKRYKKIPPTCCLLHGRFRPHDRRREIAKITDFVSQVDLETGAVSDDPGLIIVSTQVVEAGFDISSTHLWSEVSPWASVVQRLGRLNREGQQPDAEATFWMPKEDKERENHKDSPNAKRIGPYEKAALQLAKSLIQQLIQQQDNGVQYRDALNCVLATSDARDAVHTTTDIVIRPNDFHELFSTNADLAGGFADVSRFVRSMDRNCDVQVFWRELPKDRAAKIDECWPTRDELCSVPVYELRRFVSRKSSAYEWNAETHAWESRRPYEIQAGMTLLLPLSGGGYSDERGWTGDAGDRPSLLPSSGPDAESIDLDPESSGPDWVPLPDHLADVEAEAAQLVDVLALDDAASQAVVTSARWHDWGKSLRRWQESVVKTTTSNREKMEVVLDDATLARFHEYVQTWLARWEPDTNGDSQWAKFPDVREAILASDLSPEDKLDLKNRLYVPFRPNLRHEAASALAAWDQWWKGDGQLTALAVYLIASHHGKVRNVLRRTQNGSQVFGLQPTDTLEPVDHFFPLEQRLRFDCTRFGASGAWDKSKSTFQLTSPSWIQMVDELLGPIFPGENEHNDAIRPSEPHDLGPFVLSYLEAVLRIADIRASKVPGKGTRV